MRVAVSCAVRSNCASHLLALLDLHRAAHRMAAVGLESVEPVAVVAVPDVAQRHERNRVVVVNPAVCVDQWVAT
eukprot:4977628-Prymnesium_polylepis.1